MLVRSISDLRAAIRQRRSELGLSQTELASRASVSRQWLNTFENGHRVGELEPLLAVIDHLDLEIELRPRPEIGEGAWAFVAGADLP